VETSWGEAGLEHLVFRMPPLPSSTSNSRVALGQFSISVHDLDLAQWPEGSGLRTTQQEFNLPGDILGS
jgi:hypothetical protein